MQNMAHQSLKKLTIRVSEDIYRSFEDVSHETDRSLNYTVNKFLEYMVEQAAAYSARIHELRHRHEVKQEEPVCK